MKVYNEVVIDKIKKAISKGEERGLSGAGIDLLLASLKKEIKEKYNFTDELFDEHRRVALSRLSINEGRDYYKCPDCGANLDHGEKCDCQTKSFKKKVKVSSPSQEKRSKTTVSNQLNDTEIAEEVDDPRTWLKYNEAVETTQTQILNNLRADIQDELTAVKNYDTHADEAEKAGFADIAKVLRDIRDEEKVHIGELQTVLAKHDKNYQQMLDDGEKEVKEELTESTKKQLRDARNVLADPNSTNIERTNARATINKHEFGRKAAEHLAKVPTEEGIMKNIRIQSARNNTEQGIREKKRIKPTNDDSTTAISESFLAELNNILTESGERLQYLTLLKNYQTLTESVLDPINKERCPDVFKGDKMLPKVRTFILSILNDFKAQANFPIDIKNIYMIGSSTGYQYNITSDIDIEVETNLDQKKFNQIFKIIPKGITLPGTERPINIFIIKDNDKYDFDKAENVYDVMGDKFLKKTDKATATVPYQYIKDLSTFFMNGCELALNKFDRDVQEMKEYLRLDPKTMEISEKEKHEAVTRKLVDLRNDVDVVRMAHHILFAFEKEGYENMPFKVNIEVPNKEDPRYSVNNLVYKMVDKFGYLERLDAASKEGKKLIKEVEDQYGK